MCRRLLVPLLLVGATALTGVACDTAPSASPSTPVIDDRGVRLRELRTAVDAVATAQATADQHVNTALDATLAVDRSVARFLDPATLYDQGDAWDQVQAVVDAARFEDLREPYFEVALAADRARSALSRAREDVGDDWERRYLDAQDEVLLAVRRYAEEADRVAQLLERHGPTYLALAAQNQSFTERRFYFRDAEEAADAYATEVDPLLDDLVTAEQQLAAQVATWRDAGIAVNDASAAAREIYEERPAG